MVRLAFAVLLAVTAPSAGIAAQGWPSSISVDEAVDLAMKGSTMLRAKQQEFQATQAISLLDFLDAERAYRDTTLEHVRALGGCQTALDELEAAIGYGKGR